MRSEAQCRDLIAFVRSVRGDSAVAQDIADELEDRLKPQVTDGIVKQLEGEDANNYCYSCGVDSSRYSDAARAAIAAVFESLPTDDMVERLTRHMYGCDSTGSTGDRVRRLLRIALRGTND